MLNKFSYRVYYEDTDAQGVVYYANYLKFAERARTDFLRDLKISQSELREKEKLLFVVRKCEVEYLASGHLDDLLEVSVEVKEVSTTSMLLHQSFKKDEKILAHLIVQIVCVDSETMRPKKIPDSLKALFLKEGSIA